MNRSSIIYNNNTNTTTTNNNDLISTNPNYQKLYHNHIEKLYNSKKNLSNSLRNSPTFSIQSEPYFNQSIKNNNQHLTTTTTKSIINNQSNIDSSSLSMINIKKILERLKNEVDIERNKRTLMIKQHNHNINKLTKQSKIDHSILLYALKHAENKAKLYRDEYYKLKTKVQTKYNNSEQENSKTNNTIQNKQIYSNEKSSLKNQSDWVINKNFVFITIDSMLSSLQLATML
ncbi:unnamed protein product [Schistosoma intercalatum]|nr:unnamed protein product [Schistosoma intercalatum]CAH8520847.1 unnamed protein product [Schistosoma intercalatum]